MYSAPTPSKFTFLSGRLFRGECLFGKYGDWKWKRAVKMHIMQSRRNSFSKVLLIKLKCFESQIVLGYQKTDYDAGTLSYSCRVTVNIFSRVLLMIKMSGWILLGEKKGTYQTVFCWGICSCTLDLSERCGPWGRRWQWLLGRSGERGPFYADQSRPSRQSMKNGHWENTSEWSGGKDKVNKCSLKNLQNESPGCFSMIGERSIRTSAMISSCLVCGCGLLIISSIAIDRRAWSLYLPWAAKPKLFALQKKSKKRSKSKCEENVKKVWIILSKVYERLLRGIEGLRPEKKLQHRVPEVIGLFQVHQSSWCGFRWRRVGSPSSSHSSGSRVGEKIPQIHVQVVLCHQWVRNSRNSPTMEYNRFKVARWKRGNQPSHPQILLYLSINQAIEQSSTHWSIDHSKDHWLTNPSINQSIDPSILRMISQSIHKRITLEQTTKRNRTVSLGFASRYITQFPSTCSRPDAVWWTTFRTGPQWYPAGRQRTRPGSNTAEYEKYSYNTTKWRVKKMDSYRNFNWYHPANSRLAEENKFNSTHAVILPGAENGFRGTKIRADDGLEEFQHTDHALHGQFQLWKTLVLKNGKKTFHNYPYLIFLPIGSIRDKR